MSKSERIQTLKKQTIRWTAAMMLASTMCGLFSPAAVAMSRDSISSVADSAGLSSDAKDFFVDVLEGGMLATASVVQVFSTFNRARTNGRVLFVLSGSADFDGQVQTSDLNPVTCLIPLRDQMADCPVGKSSIQPLGP